DIIDTGGTIIGATHALQDAGAKSVTLVATHALLNGNASEALASCGAREVVVTDTVPVPEEKRFKNLTVLSIAPVLAKAIKAVFEHTSVAGIFEDGA
ncbi:MAG: ribose-phosphate diphosphokinase, partial [Aeriscardovia sp.]|nr:ribose-phosphate diphosphokinase [Aeriscardovia sp.]